MSTRLYVGNLPFHVTEEILRQAFGKTGEVVDAHVVLDRESGRSRGFGFVTMGTPEMAENAIARMNGHDLEGRALRVNPADERPPRRGGPPGGGGGGGGFGGGGGGFGGRPRGGGGGGDRDRGGPPRRGGGGGGGGDGERRFRR
jgi:RNA recognition motif-containing protein